MSIETISLLIALIVGLILYALFIPRASENFKPAEGADTPMMKIAGLLGTELINSLPADFVHKKRDKSRIVELIQKSGNPWKVTANEFFFLQFVAAIIGIMGATVLWYVLSASFSIPWFIFALVGGVFGGTYPRREYSHTAKMRDLEFKKQLPEALDLMRIALISGQTLSTAIKSAYEEMQDGVLKVEFERMVLRLESGMSMENTLDHFAKVAPNEAIISFVKAIKQAQALNVQMTETLEMRAEASRQEHMAVIDQRISTLSGKMMMILAPTMLGALGILTMAPLAETLMSI